MYLFDVVAYGLVVVAEELDEDSVGIAKKDSRFGGIGFWLLLFSDQKPSLEFIVDHHASYVEIYL